MLAAISIRNRWLIARQTLCSLLTLDTPKSWPQCCCEHISQPSDSQTGQHWQSQARHFGGRIQYDGRQHRHPAACILEWSRTGRQRCWLDGSQHGRRQSTSPAGPVVQFPLAQPGEGIKECELIKWFVKEGDVVEEFGPLCEVQSDKAAVEITSRYAGTIARLHHQPGDMVQVGAMLVDIHTSAKQAPAGAQGASSAQSAEQAATSRQGRGAEGSVQVHASPAVRRIAREQGISLENLQGTGPDGRITKEDILAASPDVTGSQQPPAPGTTPEPLRDHPAAHTQSPQGGAPRLQTAAVPPPQPASPSLGAPASAPGDDVIPLRGYRRAMVASMAAAATVPHFHFCDEVDLRALLAVRQKVRHDPLMQGVKLTFLPFMIKALSAALLEHPEVNSSLSEDGQQLRVHHAHNVGIAMATNSGLVVPNIKHVEAQSVASIAAELKRLQQLASTGRLPAEDLAGGTITISNIGTLGGTYAAPLIVPGEVAIVALGRVQAQPRYAPDGDIVKASVMAVSWGADHRVLDGAAVATLNSSWKQYLEEPERLLLKLV